MSSASVLIPNIVTPLMYIITNDSHTHFILRVTTLCPGVPHSERKPCFAGHDERKHIIFRLHAVSLYLKMYPFSNFLAIIIGMFT